MFSFQIYLLECFLVSCSNLKLPDKSHSNLRRLDSGEVVLNSMEINSLQPGTLVSLSELHPSSQYFKDGASLRVTGRLQEYHVETAIAIIVDGGSMLKINTQHLCDVSFRNGSMYQFIGELDVQLDNESILKARVGRNVDGIDLNLYHQSIKLLRQFQAEHQKK